MKKICIILLVIALVIFAKYFDFVVCRDIITAKIIEGIEVDAVDEVDNGVITLKIDGQYYDYAYEYNEGFKTLQERINNGENVNEWAEIIK